MVQLAGFVYDSAGVALSTGITVNIYARNTVTPVVVSPTVNASGYWQATGVAEGRYDVEIVNGTTTRRIKYDDELQVQRVETAVLQVRNPANTFIYDVVPGAITANRTLNLPVITGTDTLAVLSLAQTFSTGVKTFNSSILAIRNPADTFSYTVVASAITAARNLTIPLITADDTLAVLGLAQTFSATQTFSAATAAAFGSNTVTGAFTASGSTVTFSGGTASTSTSTGTIVISGSGGLGVGGQGWFGANLRVSHANPDTSGLSIIATTTTNAAALAFTNVAGGSFYVGRDSSTGNRIQTASALAYAGVIWLETNHAITFGTNNLERFRIAASGEVSAYSSTASTSTTTGALVVTGGIGVGGALYLGGLLAISSGINEKIGATTARATTEATNALYLFDGTAPVGTLTNGITLYSTSGELRVMDSAGNATLLSPHARDGSWIYDSVSPVTGKHLRVDMERMVKFLNEKFGQDWVKEVAA